MDSNLITCDASMDKCIKCMCHGRLHNSRLLCYNKHEATYFLITIAMIYCNGYLIKMNSWRKNYVTPIIIDYYNKCKKYYVSNINCYGIPKYNYNVFYVPNMN